MDYFVLGAASVSLRDDCFGHHIVHVMYVAVTGMVACSLADVPRPQIFHTPSKDRERNNRNYCAINSSFIPQNFKKGSFYLKLVISLC